MRVTGRLMAALCLLAGLLGLGLSAAGPASAHAQLLSTDPAPGARLDHAPQQISLTFGEAVSFVPGGFRLLDRAGSSLTLGEPQHRGDTVIVPLTDTPGDGAYVFSWRVVSADTHPVAGAIPFTVGAAVPGATLPAFAAGSTPGSTRVLADVDRWLGYAGAIGGAGVLGFGLLCWPAARTDRIARRLGVVGGVLVALTAVAGLPLQASAAGGEPLGEVFGDDSIRAVLATSYGHAALGRIVLGLLLAALVATRSRTRAVDAAAVVTALGLLACFSLAGHPAVSDVPALTVADDVAHLAAVTVWLGGLLMLTVRLLPDPRAELGEVLRRWSPVAMSAVSLILVTGTIQAWRELAGVSALVDTGYGRWLLVKTGGLVALVALGNLGRRSVRAWAREPVPALAGASLGAMRAQPRPVLRDRLRRSVAAELMIAAGVLVASTLLVVADPRQRPAASAPAVAIASSARVALPTGPMVNVTADPATAGAPTLTITTSSTDGSVLDPVEVDATAAMPAHGIEPIPLPLTRTDAGHYRVEAAPMGFAGVWDVTVTVRTSDIDSGVGTVKITLH